MFKTNFKSQANAKKTSPTAKLDLSKFTETGIPKRAILSKEVKSNGSLASQSKETMQLDFDPQLLEKLINSRLSIGSPLVKFQLQNNERVSQASHNQSKNKDTTAVERSSRPLSSKTPKAAFQKDNQSNERSPGSKGGSYNKQEEAIFTRLKKARSEQASRENSLSRSEVRDPKVYSQTNVKNSKEQYNSPKAQSEEKAAGGNEGKMFKQIEQYMAATHFGTSSLVNLAQMEDSVSKFEKMRPQVRSQSTANLNNLKAEEINELLKSKTKAAVNSHSNTFHNTARSTSPQNNTINPVKSSNPSARPSTAKAKEKIIMNSQNSSQKPEILKYSLGAKKKSQILNSAAVPKTQLKLRTATLEKSRQNSLKNLHLDNNCLVSASQNNSISIEVSKEGRSVSPSESSSNVGSTKNVNYQNKLYLLDQSKQQKNSSNANKASNTKQPSNQTGGQLDLHARHNSIPLYHSFSSSITSTSATAHKDSALSGTNSISKSNADEQMILNQNFMKESENQDEVARVLKDIQTLINPDKPNAKHKRAQSSQPESLKLNADPRNKLLVSPLTPREEENEELKTEIKSLKEKVERMQGSIVRFQESFTKMMVSQETVNNKLNMILAEEFSGRNTDPKKSSERETIRDYCTERSEITPIITPKSGYQSISDRGKYSDRGTCGAGGPTSENTGDYQE